MPRQAHSITTPQKSRIRQDLEDGLSIRAVAKKWKLARSSVTYIRDAPTDRTIKSTGRPPLIPQATMDQIERYIGLNWHTTCKDWTILMHEFKLDCSLSTFRRAMHRQGLGRYIAARTPLRTRVQRINRFKWGSKFYNNSSKDWHRILWTDECTFELDLRVKQRVTRRLGERFNPMKTQWQKRRKAPGRLNIWGGIAYNYKSPLIWLEGSGKNGAFLQKDYVQQVLEGQMEEILGDVRTVSRVEPILMEDGNTAHGLKTESNPAAKWKRLHDVLLLDWASNSPDLNPIEQIWRIMKQNLRKRRTEIHTLQEYRTAIQEEWDRIPISKINELISSMGERAKAVYNSFGDATGF